jgi:hypothetical protein
VVPAEARIEQDGAHDDDAYPSVAATAVVAEPVSADSSLTTHALTGSNRFIPVAVASALPNLPSTITSSSEESDDDNSNDVRPDLLSATVYKRSRNAPVGIVLMNNANAGGVTIKRIEAEGLFGQSSFQAGDRVLSVNSESCEGLDSNQAADLIRKAENIVTVVVRAPNGRADRVSSMVMKENPNARVGIGFRNSRNGKLVISSIAEDGIFAHSLLNVSDTCLSINGVTCTSNMDATSAAVAVQSCPSFVTITTKTRHSTGVVVAASPETTPMVTSNSAVPNTATAAAPSAEGSSGAHQGRSKVCGIIAIAIVIVIIAVIASAGKNEDDYDYNYDCTYINCNVCGRNYYCGYSEYNALCTFDIVVHR